MVTVSVVLYRHKFKSVEPLFRSLVDSPVERVFVVDQSPEKQRFDQKELEEFLKVKSSSIPFEYIKAENKGYGAGHNIALKKADALGSNYHLVINPDVCYGANVIPDICAYMDKHIEVGMLMPKVFYPNGDLQRLCKLLPTPKDMIKRLMLPRFFQNENTDDYELIGSGYNRIMDVPYLSGCFMFFRTSVLKEVGMFDEHFFMYAEDIDMTRRIHAKYKTIFFPSVSITHIHNRADRRSLRLLLVHVINIIKYFNKWGWVWDKERDEFNDRILREIKTIKI